MRSRLFAIIILIVLLGIPLVTYWYFFTKKVSGISVSIGDDISFVVELQGTLSSSWLPLADKFLVYKKECKEYCQLSPIPPVPYNLTITSTGKVIIHDEFLLPSGTIRELSYTAYDDIRLISSTGTIADRRLGESLIENANTNLQGEFSLIGVGENSRIYSLRKKDGQVQLGVLFPEKFIPFRTLPGDTEKVTLDSTGRFFILPLANNNTFLLSVDMTQETEVSLLPRSVVFMNGSWKLQTASGSYLYDGENISENPRFTDFLDVSSFERIGYIDRADSARLSLSNFPQGTSVLISLNRLTGESYIIRKGIDIDTLFFQGDTPAYIDNSGKVWNIQVGD